MPVPRALQQGIACGKEAMVATNGSGKQSRLYSGCFAIGLAAATCVLITTATNSAHAVTIDMVTVGNAGNAPDPATGSLYGAVNYEYQIGKYEVTIGQYCEFLNAVAKSDPYGLWISNMETNLNIAGIARSGSSGSYAYSVIGPSGTTPAGADSPGNRPIAFTSWFDAARFANWMQNGQGSGGTETGAYTLNGATGGTAPAKNPGAQFYIPTESEWYKAAYYSPVKGGVGLPGYNVYATQSGSAPGNVVGSGTNQVNYMKSGLFSATQSGYSANQNYLTNVGAFTNSASYYGTLDQSGNVWEWNSLSGAINESCGLRGGSAFDSDAVVLSISYRFELNTSFQNGGTGFRLASPIAVPEPSTYAIAVAGMAGGLAVWRRRRC